MGRRDKGIASADRKLNTDPDKKDYGINEISTGLLARYAAKAAKSGMNTAFQLGQDSMDKSKERTRDLISTRKVRNRAKGIDKAAKNLASRDFTYTPAKDDGDHEYRCYVV